jgi:hypothetical protein
MKYYLDCEFNGFGGDLISLAIVRHDGPYMYLADERFLKLVEWSTRSAIRSPGIDQWVWDNVLPLMGAKGGITPVWIPRSDFGSYLQSFFQEDEDNHPLVITDWPDDIKYFCECLITGPGEMINIPGIKFEMHRVDAYPTTLPGAIQHNAYCDAVALRQKLQVDPARMLDEMKDLPLSPAQQAHVAKGYPL